MYVQECADRNVSCCYISALVITCFCLKKGRATFFWPETIVARFLHFMVLLPKVLFNHVPHTFHCIFIFTEFIKQNMLLLYFWKNNWSNQTPLFKALSKNENQIHFLPDFYSKLTQLVYLLFFQFLVHAIEGRKNIYVMAQHIQPTNYSRKYLNAFQNIW